MRSRVAAAILSLPFAAGALHAWQESLTRQGAYWVQTIRGTEEAAPGGRLRVSTRGPVVATGHEAVRVEYTYVQRVRARTEEEARRRLGQMILRTSRSGDQTVLSLAHGGNGVSSAEIQLQAPRGLREVVIETYGGAVEASNFTGVLQAQTGGRIKLDQIGGAVVARTAGGEIILGVIGGAVRCVSAGGPIRAAKIGGRARFETAGGDIAVREVEGNVVVSTAGGGIQIGRAGGAVTVNTAGGSIEIGSAKGVVSAESGGGSIEIRAAAGVRCETGGGAIRLSNVTGNLRASTAVGNISASLLGGAAESFLSTGSGDITLLVPSNLAITIEAQNDAGASVRRIVSDFPGVEIRRMGPVVFGEGPINGGGPVVRLSASAGTIYIRRQE